MCDDGGERKWNTVACGVLASMKTGGGETNKCKIGCMWIEVACGVVASSKIEWEMVTGGCSSGAARS